MDAIMILEDLLTDPDVVQYFKVSKLIATGNAMQLQYQGFARLSRSFVVGTLCCFKSFTAALRVSL